MKLTLNLASRKYVNHYLLRQVYLLIGLALLFCLALQTRNLLKSRAAVVQLEAALQQQQQHLQRRDQAPLSTEQLKARETQHQLARQLLQRDAFRWTALFDRFEKILPTGVAIRSFSPDYQKRSLLLTGQARGLGELRRFLDNLHQESFSQVFLQNQHRVEVEDGGGGKKPALEFSIKLEGVF